MNSIARYVVPVAAVYAALMSESLMAQSSPSGMVAVPSFGSVAVPDTQKQNNQNTDTESESDETERPAQSGSSSQQPVYPPPPPPDTAYPPPLPPGYPTPPPPPSGYPPPPTDSGYPSSTPPSSSSSNECGDDPTGACAARVLGESIAALVNLFGNSKFDPAKASRTSCPGDTSVKWSNCTGKFVGNTGVEYDGSWFNDKRHGFGMSRYPDGRVYRGEYREDSWSGRGELTAPNGDRYIGTFKDSALNGEGTYVWTTTGDRYVGNFVNSKFDGEGIQYDGRGSVVVSGDWRQDELVKNRPLDTSKFSYDRDTPVSVAVTPAAPRVPSSSARSSAPEASPPAAARGTSSCSPGPELESREYASPEYIGRPAGRRARMCFYRTTTYGVDRVKFFPGGIFYITSQTGSGGFAMSGSVNQTTRGTYGFAEGGKLNLRIAYTGTGVSQSTRGAGSNTTLDVAGSDTQGRAMTLPNCQVVRVRDETRVIALGAGRAHPDSLTMDGAKWQSDSDCGDWEGWK